MQNILKKIRRWSSRTKIKAITSEESEVMFSSQLIKQKIVVHEVFCHICRKEINSNNWQLMSKLDDEIIFSCNEPFCIFQFIQKMREEN